MVYVYFKEVYGNINKSNISPQSIKNCVLQSGVIVFSTHSTGQTHEIYTHHEYKLLLYSVNYMKWINPSWLVYLDTADEQMDCEAAEESQSSHPALQV